VAMLPTQEGWKDEVQAGKKTCNAATSLVSCHESIPHCCWGPAVASKQQLCMDSSTQKAPHCGQ
jgi:hypothetical protein